MAEISIQLLQVNSLVILFQYLFIRRAVQGHALSANLAHADAVPPTASVKRDAQNVALGVALDIEGQQAVALTEQCAQVKRANRLACVRADDICHERSL